MLNKARLPQGIQGQDGRGFGRFGQGRRQGLFGGLGRFGWIRLLLLLLFFFFFFLLRLILHHPLNGFGMQKTLSIGFGPPFAILDFHIGVQQFRQGGQFDLSLVAFGFGTMARGGGGPDSRSRRRFSLVCILFGKAARRHGQDRNVRMKEGMFHWILNCYEQDVNEIL